MSSAQLSVMEGKGFWTGVKTPEFLPWLSSDFLHALWGLGVPTYKTGPGRSILILCYGSDGGLGWQIQKKQNNNNKTGCLCNIWDILTVKYYLLFIKIQVNWVPYIFHLGISPTGSWRG